MRCWPLIFFSACLVGCIPRVPDVPEPGFALAPRQAPIHPGARLTLARCLELADAQNPQIIMARLARESARLAFRQTLLQLGPTIKLTGRAAAYDDPQRVTPASASGASGSVSTRELANWEAALSWNLWAFGRDWERLSLARDSEKAAAWDALQVRRAVRLAVIAAYAQLLTQNAVAQAMEESARAMEEYARRMQELLEQDKAAPLDVDAVRLRAAALRDQARQERSQAELARLRLFFLLGQPPVSVELDSLPETAPGIAFAQTPKWDEILARRPDVQAARARYRAQAARIRSMEADFWPSLSLAASWGQRLDVSAWPVPADHMNAAGYVGLDVSWNLFESGRLLQAIDQERIQLDILRQRLRQMELDAVQEIRLIQESLRTQAERMQSARGAWELASRSLQAQRQRLEMGQITFAEFRLLEADALDARVRLLQASAQVYVLSAQLAVAMGNTP